MDLEEICGGMSEFIVDSSWKLAQRATIWYKPYFPL